VSETRDEESSLGVAGAIVSVREKQTTPGGISRIIYLKWQRRFSEPKHQMRTRPESRDPGVWLFLKFFFFFFASVPFHNHNPTPTPESARAISIPRLTSSTRSLPPALPHNMCTRIRPPETRYCTHGHRPPILSRLHQLTLSVPFTSHNPAIPAASRFFPIFVP